MAAAQHGAITTKLRVGQDVCSFRGNNAESEADATAARQGLMAMTPKPGQGGCGHSVTWGNADNNAKSRADAAKVWQGADDDGAKNGAGWMWRQHGVEQC